MNFNINQTKSLFTDSEYLKPHDNNINYPSIFNINNSNNDISECYFLFFISVLLKSYNEFAKSTY